ncbi:Pkinase-domain-containing protein [Hesseltinella vesiculosa]|uniref:non-specific serine/threonine protein kinase n=1 Tax=Hesseltinella vesiculosa TaxID=101127 RepID=A0A1X2G6Z4_9FUNG|nr:Pkinase-domain-containing protein [Hesseltinella vesiculosa]
MSESDEDLVIPSLDDSCDSLFAPNKVAHAHTCQGPNGNRILRDSSNMSSQLPDYAGPDTPSSPPKPSPKQPAAALSNNLSTTIRRVKPRGVIGNYTLVSTIGSGSMGKVRLAIHNLTQEKLAVKIVPRVGTQGKIPQTEAEAKAKREKDKQREIRTIREASIMLLLYHPHIVSLKELVVLDPYYYMFMEYVDGGVLIDYIISHGKLKERHARRFSRQIISALDYLHKNSLVHRDLKIENILISRTGQIKIIDFGLSNLFSPRSHLKTFCGSLYFAAPELLNAKAYTGPEVDVWSFGVVLFVLVCGKVPFDDENLPALHQKIKRGVVEYPFFLSSDCKNILSRMLVVNPSHRATTTEIMTHPWMNKGYDEMVDNHLPERVPLSLPVDMEVVRGMTGFEFGSEQEIKQQLEDIIQSDEYQQAAAVLAERQSEIHQQLHPQQKHHQHHHHRHPLSRFGHHHHQQQPPYPSPDDDPHDVPAAYHPLVSIYYLVRERMDRERENDAFSDSPLSPNLDSLRRSKSSSPRAIHTRSSFASLQQEKRSQPFSSKNQTSYPTSGSSSHLPAAATSPPADTGLKNQPHTPSITIPEAAHHPDDPPPTSSTATGAQQSIFGTQQITQGVAYGNRGKTKIRVDAMGRIVNGDHHGFLDTYHGLGRVFSKRHTHGPDHASSSTALQDPADPRHHRHHRHGSVTDCPPLKLLSHAFVPPHHGHHPRHEDLLHTDLTSTVSPTSTASQPAATTSSMSPNLHLTPPATSLATSVPTPSFSKSSRQPPRKSSTGLVIDTNPTRRHHDHENPVARLGRQLSKKIQKTTSPTSAAPTMSSPPAAKSVNDRRRPLSHSAERYTTAVAEPAASVKQGTADEEIKPVFLKGLFSVSTTSTKHPSVIRADLIRVLERMGVKWRESKRCLECVHVPSIDMHRVTPGSTSAQPVSSPVSCATSTHAMTAPVTVPDLVVRFEIYIVKVSWLPGMYGIQFHRVSGDTWQYKNMCSRILAELKL